MSPEFETHTILSFNIEAQLFQLRLNDLKGLGRRGTDVDGEGNIAGDLAKTRQISVGGEDTESQSEKMPLCLLLRPHGLSPGYEIGEGNYGILTEQPWSGA